MPTSSRSGCASSTRAMPTEDEHRQFARLTANERLLAYTLLCDPDYVADKVHFRVARELEAVERGEVKRLILNMPPRHGKQIADSCPVLTTEGWKTHGELRVGDQVFSPSGNPVKVIAVGKPSNEKMAVEFSNGETIVCHPEHEWTVYDRVNKRWTTVEAKWFVARDRLGKQRSLCHGTPGKRGCHFRFKLPHVEPLQFQSLELKVDPYVLGVWLGDGSTGKCAISMSAEDIEQVSSEFSRRGVSESCRWVHKDTGVVTASFSSLADEASQNRAKNKSKLVASLDDIGVLRSKHIPDDYQRASVEQRMDLLAGLVDTDGHVDKTGRVTFSTTRKRLADDVEQLASGLGFRPYCSSYAPVLSTGGVQGRRTVHTVGFTPTRPLPCVVDRRKRFRMPVARRVSIRSVTTAPDEPGRCIQVDSDDGLYLVGLKLIPTHNSRLTAIEFTTWLLGRNPKADIILASYAQSLSETSSKAAKARLNELEYQRVFDTRLNTRDASASDWATTDGGRYRAVGVGGAITGRGADFLIIDDPHTNYEEAHSPTMRRKVWNWYMSDAQTRLSPNGVVVIIMTRWHTDDLVGRLLDPERQKEMEADGVSSEPWRVVNFPAIAKDNDQLGRKRGEPLSPQRYPVKRLKQIRASMTGYIWSALYDGNPVPEGGNYIDTAKFKIRRPGEIPDGLSWVRFWDLATDEKKDSDFTAAPRCAIDANGELWIADMIRGQWKWPKARETIKRTAEDEMIEIGVEAVAGFKTALDNLREVLTCVRITEHSPSRDKLTRALPWIALADNGKVNLVQGGWVGSFLAEAAQFPSGANDDQVDGVSGAYHMLKHRGRVMLA